MINIKYNESDISTYKGVEVYSNGKLAVCSIQEML